MIVHDDTQMVISYVAPDVLTDAESIRPPRRYLHRMGRESNQGEVGIVVDGEYSGIVDYDSEES